MVYCEESQEVHHKTTNDKNYRIVTMKNKYLHITEVLFELHWLPVECRIEYNILLLTFRALNGLAPTYICDLLTRYCPTRTFRSMDQCLLTPTSANTKSYSQRAFSLATPKLCQLLNFLPTELRLCNSIDIFKGKLKTHLFKKAYA
ncbi:uncharacterized protein LOC144439264 [Glandiceps talaboti]